MSEYVERRGIIKGVQAKYKRDEPINLQAVVRFETDVPTADRWSDKDIAIDEMTLTFPLGSPVNTGDRIVMTLTVDAPVGQRFQPALEAGVKEEDVEV
ncbi:MAG: hypothetical protein DRH08_14745, partial [Deltaproteobacteria bacterium]